MLSRDAAPDETFEHDHKNCMACDAFIAIALNPSTGLGMEIVTCLERRNENNWNWNPAFVFAVAARQTNVSKLLEGWKNDAFIFKRYESFDQIPDLFEDAHKIFLDRFDEPILD